MAKKYDSSMIKSKLGWSNSFNPNAAFPLDFRQYFGSLEAAQAAAATAVDFGSTDSAYYYGMQLYVFDGTSAKTYLINGDNTLNEIGSNTSPMMFVADEAAMLALTDIEAGQQVYREDTSTVWIYKGTSASDINNWAESAAQNDTIWQGTENKVNFHALTKATYDAITTKSDSTLYFLTDVGKIYKGTTDVTSCIALSPTDKPIAETSPAECCPGKLYFDESSLAVYVTFDNANWNVVSPGYLTDGANWATAHSGRLATIGLIKKGIAEAINAINLDASFDAATGNVKVGNGAKAQLTGVAHSVEYDSTNMVITIPVYGGDDVVVNIPKDKFVTAGTYNAETQNIELTIEGQVDPVTIPAAALVNIYEADNTDKNVTVTVTDDNKISATFTITAAGSDNDELVVVDASGNVIGKSGVTVKKSGDLGDSNVEIPVAAVIASAIATAVSDATKALGTSGNIATFDADGSITDSTLTFGTGKLSGTPSDKTLATEAAVADALGWESI